MIKKLLLALCLAFTLVTAQADDLRDRAIAAQAADVTTTVVALTAVDGIKEGNPLGIAVVPLKIGLLIYADKQADPVVRADLHRALSATGWGPAVNNVCAIAVVASGGGSTAPCLVLGLAAAIADWNITYNMREKAVFDTICEREKENNPAITTCTYTIEQVATDYYLN